MSISATYCDKLNRYAIHLDQASIYLSKEEGEQLTALLLTLGKGKGSTKHDMGLIEAACDSYQEAQAMIRGAL